MGSRVRDRIDVVPLSGYGASDLWEAASDRVGRRLRWRIVQRLEQEIERELFEGGLVKPPTNEQAAMAMIKQLASQLDEDAEALESAAKQLKEDGKGYRANQAYLASRKARLAARSLLGNE